MPFDVHGALLVAVVAGVTALIRFLPFVVFGGGRPTPKFVVYLAGVLPCAIMAMLVVYCLRGVDLLGLIDADDGIGILLAARISNRNLRPKEDLVVIALPERVDDLGDVEAFGQKADTAINLAEAPFSIYIVTVLRTVAV